MIFPSLQHLPIRKYACLSVEWFHQGHVAPKYPPGHCLGLDQILE